MHSMDIVDIVQSYFMQEMKIMTKIKKSTIYCFSRKRKRILYYKYGLFDRGFLNCLQLHRCLPPSEFESTLTDSLID